jgi:hypothetical protein
MSRLNVSFDYLQCLTRKRSRTCGFPRQSCSPCVDARITLSIKASRDQYAGLLSVTSLLGRWSRSFKALFGSIEIILQDDLDKTIVSCAPKELGSARASSMPHAINPCAVRGTLHDERQQAANRARTRACERENLTRAADRLGAAHDRVSFSARHPHPKAKSP